MVKKQNEKLICREGYGRQAFFCGWGLDWEPDMCGIGPDMLGFLN